MEEEFFIPKLIVPLPVMAAVTSNSTICPTVTLPTVLNAVPLIVGALVYFSPVSAHGVEVPR